MIKFRRFTPFALLAPLFSLLAGGSALATGTQRVELHGGSDYEGGELQGVAIDSSGKLRPGFNLGDSPLTDASTIWSVLVRRDGSVLLGTGNEGKLFKYAAGGSSLLAESKGLTLSALAEGWNDTVLAGAIGSGTVLGLKGGKLEDFSKLPGAQHVFALAYDAQAKALYAGTGPEGKVFRITADGNAQVYFDADEQHIVSLAVNSKGHVFAGASDAAKLYDIAGAGRASVLYDFGRTEVRAVAVSAQDEVYAIANEIKLDAKPAPKATGGDKDSATPVAVGTPGKGKGTLYRFDAQGRPEQLIDDDDEYFSSLALNAEGVPYVGTGIEGRVYTVDDAHTVSLVADTAQRQVSALVMAGKTQLVATSDPAVVHPVRGIGGADALWTSKPLDLHQRARFGLLSWLSSGTVELSTRTGNTAVPDKTWSDWSAPLTAPAVVQSPAARYLQLRARFNRDPKAELSDITIPFLPDNLRHVVTGIEVTQTATQGVADPGGKVKSSGGPIESKSDASVTLKWTTDNPDEDELVYRLQYRLVGTTTWYDMLKPAERLTKDTYKWDTSDLPEGRYRVRVVASDELSNPPDQVTRHELQSSLVTVDNTPPTLLDLKSNGRTITALAVDGVGPIARVEMSLAGRDEWFPFHPLDGLFDEQREELRADVSSLVPAGPALLSIRIYDQAGNVTVRSVALK